MPMPTISNKDKILCPAYYQYGIKCRRPVCDKARTPLDKLTLAIQKAWISHVKGNNDINFNPRRVQMATDGGGIVRVAAKRTPANGQAGEAAVTPVKK